MPARPYTPPSDLLPSGALSSARMLTEVVARLRRALRVSIRAECPWEALPMAQVELLQDLAEHVPVRVGDLAARKRLAPSTVSGLIGQMINSGLVARAVDPADRRASAVTLTAAGKAQLDAWAGSQEERLNSALDALEDADRELVRAALPALLRLAEQLDE